MYKKGGTFLVAVRHEGGGRILSVGGENRTKMASLYGIETIRV